MGRGWRGAAGLQAWANREATCHSISPTMNLLVLFVCLTSALRLFMLNPADILPQAGRRDTLHVNYMKGR